MSGQSQHKTTSPRLPCTGFREESQNDLPFGIDCPEPRFFKFNASRSFSHLCNILEITVRFTIITSLGPGRNLTRYARKLPRATSSQYLHSTKCWSQNPSPDPNPGLFLLYSILKVLIFNQPFSTYWQRYCGSFQLHLTPPFIFCKTVSKIGNFITSCFNVPVCKTRKIIVPILYGC